jgi:hypothetical protein
MSDETQVYVSVEGKAGHLVVEGPLVLLRELLHDLGQHTTPAPEPSSATVATVARP